MIRRVRALLGRAGREEAHSRFDPQELQKARQELARKAREIARLRAQLVRKDAGGQGYGIEPERVIWIFGTARSGSTWLASMMRELEGQHVWNEPLVGALLGNFYYERAEHRQHREGKNFILGRRYKDTWLGPVRALVLGGAAARFPEAVEGGYVVIKEPNGSRGAPLLMEALPESRMILLVRDPRDVVASAMDSRREDSWRYQRRRSLGDKRVEGASEQIVKRPDQFVRSRATSYVQAVGNARQAYETHEGRKVVVRYEELRYETLATMRRLYAQLEIPVDEERLVRAVEKHSWENIPEEQKGPGKFYRKARPGGWREDLTPEQAMVVEKITAPLMKDFYP